MVTNSDFVPRKMFNSPKFRLPIHVPYRIHLKGGIFTFGAYNI